jgi:hypothetical protein
MSSYVQARLDRESQKALDQLVKLGWSRSQAFREGVRLLAGGRRAKNWRGIIWMTSAGRESYPARHERHRRIAG